MDLGVTYTGLNNQFNASANLNGAAQESRIKPLGIQAQLKTELGKLHVEKNDNGMPNNGSVGMWSNVIKAAGSMAATAAIGAIAGPVAGAVAGAAFAAKDAVSSVAAAPKQEHAYYSLARSLNEFDARKQDADSFQYSNPADDPIYAHYISACDGVAYQHGFASRTPATGIQALMAQKMDTAEERHTLNRIGALARLDKDLMDEGSTVRGLAPKMGVVVAEGPTPPAMGRIAFSAPGMSV